MNLKLDWKMYSVIVGLIVLVIFVLFLEKVLFFLLITLVTLVVAVILGIAHPLKYVGVELVTLSTILVGISYGPVLGGLYGFTILLAHFILGRYYIGTYLMWVLPEYVLLGIFSGLFGNDLLGSLGISFIIGLNLLNLFLTLIGESERFAKELPYAVGNTLINSVIFIQFFPTLVGFIG